MELIIRICEGVASRLRRAWHQARGWSFRGPVWLRSISIPRHPAAITLEAGAALDQGVVLLATEATAKIVVGAGCYLNRQTMLDVSERLEIGARTMIGPFCYLTDHDHQMGGEAAPGDGPLVSKPTIIGARCWLGAHVTVLKGVTIGDGTVVGAGSVVTKSLPAGVVAVGNPARVLREIASK
jgi:acetyltransferase-like isoleucine patch superfamily enzyme